MSSTGRDDGSDAYGVEEIEVTLSITDGKITTKSMSGPKSGSLELFVDGSSATLVVQRPVVSTKSPQWRASRARPRNNSHRMGRIKPTFPPSAQS